MELLWPAGLSLLLAFGAFNDIRERRLPNWLALALLIFGLAFAFVTGGPTALGWHAAHAVIALLVGMALFATGAIGGGDAKVYAGMAAFFPLAAGISLLLYVTLSGGGLVILWLLVRKILGKSKKDRDSIYAKFPYGVALASGGILLAWSGSGLW